MSHRAAIEIGHIPSASPDPREATGLRIDLARLVDTRLLIQGNSGAGKSRLLRRLAEQAHGAVQMVILDPEGEFATLREKHDFLLVGKAGEVQADPRSAALLARRLLELRVSAVVDLYELRLPDRREFVRAFVEALLALPKELYRPLLVAIDEAHLFVPERSAGEATSTDSVIALMSQGRKRGLCGVLLTQRLSKLHKDAAAECNNVVIGRTWLDVDQARAGDALGLAARDRQSLRELAAGEFLGFGPAFSRPGVTRFVGGDVATTHPTAGQRHKLEAPQASAAIRAVIDELKDLPQQAAEDLRTLQAAQARVRDLERQIKAQPKAAPAERVEVSVLKAADAKRLEAAIARSEKDGQSLDVSIAKLDAQRDRLAQAQQVVTSELGNLREQIKAATGTPAPAKVWHNDAARAAGVDRPRIEASTSTAYQDHIVRANGGLPQGEARVLRAIAQYQDGATRDQLTLLTGYKKSARDQYVQRLARRGYIVAVGDHLVALQNGLDALGPNFKPLPTGPELRQFWMAKLPQGERRVLGILVEAFPQGVGRDHLSEATGYKKSARDQYINRLGRRRLVVVVNAGGNVRASEDLF